MGDEMDDLLELLEGFGAPPWQLVTGTVEAVLREGALVVQLDGALAPTIAEPWLAERIRRGDRVLVQLAPDRHIVHGVVPPGLVMGG